MSLGLVMLRVVAVAAWAQVGMPILARQETQRGGNVVNDGGEITNDDASELQPVPSTIVWS